MVKTRTKYKKMLKNIPIIGLTGAAGAGKTTVARQFEKLGCAVIYADQLNHQVLNRPEVVQQLQRWWGPKVLGPNGQVNRQAVGQIVFQDDNELGRLAALVHPLIIEWEKQLLQGYQADTDYRAVVLDVPLLVELGQEKLCDFVVFIRTDELLRQARLSRQRGWEVEKTKKIEKLQIALDTKEKMSDYVICNNSNIPELFKQVSNIFANMVRQKR